jgi:phenylpyruvate tautomerase PptA (4-oxalocrotonate tautomerase family)
MSKSSKEAKAKKPFYKKVWFWLIVVVIVIGACSSGGNKDKDSSDEASTAVSIPDAVVEAFSESAETAETTKKEAVATQPSKPVESSTEAQTTAESTEDTESEKDAFIDQVTKAIQGGIGEGESITGVSLNDENVLITVDLSQVDPAPLTMEDLALSRVGSITDAFLEITDYDDLWTSVTIDFGSDIGKVTCYKDDIESNGYGRYFPEEKYDLEQ